MSEIRVENIIGETGTDAVKFTKGINVTGVTTATSFSGSGASLTSLPAANLTGTLPAISGANLTGISAGITGADIWRITATITMATSFAIVQSNLSRANDSSSFTIGSGMTVSSGVWTFPATGLWMVRTDLSINSTSGAVNYLQFDTYFSSDTGSSYDKVARGLGNCSDTGSYASMSTCCFVDVTNTSTDRLKFEANASGTNARIYGEGNNNTSTLTFIRLADT